MKKLLIDTATQALIIVLEIDNEVKDSIMEIVTRDHSSKLMPCIDLLLSRNQIDIKEIDQIIASVGPGSYTGVRIGVTIAKTLSYALNVPLKMISTLKVMSASYMNQAEYIVPLIDARRGNVFSALYQVKNETLHCILEEQLYPYDKLIERIKEVVKEDVYFVGIDILEFRMNELKFHYHSNFVSDFNPNLVMKLEFESVNDPHTLVPNYKRLTEAELNLK